MNRKEFTKYPLDHSGEGRETTIGRMTSLPHEGLPALTANSPTSSALWRLSLVLREIAESLELRGDRRELQREGPAEDTLAADNGEMNIRAKPKKSTNP